MRSPSKTNGNYTKSELFLHITIVPFEGRLDRFWAMEVEGLDASRIPYGVSPVPSPNYFLGENFGLVGPAVKERSSYPFPGGALCSVAVSRSLLRKMIIRMSVWR